MREASGPSKYHASRYTGSLAAAGALAASGAALGATLLTNGAAISWRRAPLTGLPWIVTLIALMLLASIFTVNAAWLAIHAVRTGRYLRAIHRFTSGELQHAGIRHVRQMLPLTSVTLLPRSNSAEREVSGHGQALVRLRRARRTLALGPAGAGKTTMLVALGHDSSAPGVRWAAIVGVKRLPVMVSLPGLAKLLREGSAVEAYVADQLARFGSEALAARAPRLLRRGAITLLCDDYDALDAESTDLVNGALTRLSQAPFSRCQLTVACDSERYTDDLNLSVSLNALPAERFEPLTSRLLTQMARWEASRKQPKSRAAAFVADMMRAPFGSALLSPAGARALSIAFAHGLVPAGYGELMRSVLLIKRDEALSAPDHASERGGQDVALVWGALAASLEADASAFLPLDLKQTMGECAATWLRERPPLLPVSFALQSELAFDADALEYGIKAGLETGVLRRHVDGLGVAFSGRIWQDTAAAYWLDQMDNGLGRLNSMLLAPAWSAPVVLWASSRLDSGDVAQRIFRLTQSPDSVASRMGFTRRDDATALTLALALAAVVMFVEPLLRRGDEHDAEVKRRRFFAQQDLRDVLDAVAIIGADPARRPCLSTAVQRVNQRVGPMLETSLRALIAQTSLDRLARAQTTLALGLLGTDSASETLVEMFDHTDLSIRQAARQGLVYLGSNAVPTLQQLSASDDSTVRDRARDALSYLSATLPSARAATGPAAVNRLESADPRERRAAAAMLGAVRDTAALDALIARLDDTDREAQVAAAKALGQLGAPAGFAALRRHAESHSSALRAAIAEALGVSPDAQSIPTLIKLLKDKDATVRARAAAALGSQRDRTAAGPLREATRDIDPWVSHAAQAALQRLTGV